MKNIFIPLIAIVSFLIPHKSFSQYENKSSTFYFGFGTSVSTFVGEDIGNRFGFRLFSQGNRYNRNVYSQYNKDQYNQNESQPTTSLSPTQLSFFGGINVNDRISLEVETSIFTHNAGKIDPDYQFGTIGNLSYVDYNEDASLLAIPLIASIKIYPAGKNSSFPLYLSGGYGVQFVNESSERLREVYSNNYYSPYYYGRVYPVESVSESQFNTGFKVGLGYSYSLFGMMRNDLELGYSSFNTKGIVENSPLSINRSNKIGNIGLSMRMYLGM
jgi:opacity protein-like surface antigen